MTNAPIVQCYRYTRVNCNPTGVDHRFRCSGTRLSNILQQLLTVAVNQRTFCIPPGVCKPSMNGTSLVDRHTLPRATAPTARPISFLYTTSHTKSWRVCATSTRLLGRLDAVDPSSTVLPGIRKVHTEATHDTRSSASCSLVAGSKIVERINANDRSRKQPATASKQATTTTTTTKERRVV